jgi:hypothetical protein
MLEIDLKPTNDQILTGAQEAVPSHSDALCQIGVAGVEQQLSDRQVVEMDPVRRVKRGDILDETITRPK